ncbi:protein RecA [Spirochaetia bacterium]|nr:protein RecA [Spirochaetia bacterium]
MADKNKGSDKTIGNPLASGEEKLKALEAARLHIEKQFGSGSLIQMGNNGVVAEIETIPSGSILLDEALGIGGYPRGRIIEIYGPESSGKTTLALHAVAEAQKLGGIAAFVDAEHALDPVYAKNLGVNIDDLWVSQPDSGEQALEITESLVRSGAVDVIVVDSVAALTPQAEIDGDMGDAQMGLQARLMSQAMRKLTAIIGRSRTLLIFINQIRMKIGIMFGNPETTTGGNALKFYSSLRLEVRKTETIEAGKDTDAIGNRVKVKVAKNKVAPPFRKAELEIIFGKGISANASILDAAVKHEIIDKKGAWYTYGEEKVGQGRDNAKEYLEQHPDFTKEVELKLRKIMFPGRDLPQAAPKKPAAAKAAVDAALSADSGISSDAGVTSAAITETSAVTSGVAETEAPQIAPRAIPEESYPRVAEEAPVYGESAALAAAESSPAPARRPGRPPGASNGAGLSGISRGPGRPAGSGNASKPAVAAPAPAQAASRGPGRPRKNPDDSLF